MRTELRTDSAAFAGNTSICSSTQSDIQSDQLIKETRVVAKQLADDIVRYVTVSPAPPPGCRHAGTLRRVVDEVSQRHKIVFESIVRKVGVRNRCQPADVAVCQQTFKAVANELFSDDQYNWGRVAMLYAFAAWLAKHPSDHPSQHLGNDEIAQAIAETAGDYVAERLSIWICQQGGWDTMEIFFEEHESFEPVLWRGLMAALVGLGAMAVFATLTR